MAIRFARLEDIETLVAYWREFHSQSAFAHLTLDEVKLATTMRRLIEDKSGAFCFFVAEGENGRPAGVIVGQMDSYYFSNDPVAKMVFYWVHPQYRYSSIAVRLMLGLKQWAQNRRAKELSIAVTSGESIGVIDKMMRKMGGELKGGNYVISGL
ncbi:MAG: GNAT family N-acetyltransferase [Pseudomonadota bacterium]